MKDHGIAVRRLGPGELRPADGAAALPALCGGARARARAASARRASSKPRPAPAWSPQALHAALPDAEIVATDLNQPMLDVAARAARLGQGAVRAGRRAGPAVRRRQLRPRRLPVRRDVLPRQGAAAMPRRAACCATAGAICWRSGTGSNATRSPNRAADADRLLSRRPAVVHARRPVQLSRRGADRSATCAPPASTTLRSRPSSCAAAARRRTMRRAALCYGTPMGVEIAGPRPGQPRARVRSGRAGASRRSKGPDGIDAPMSAHIVTATK